MPCKSGSCVVGHLGRNDVQESNREKDVAAFELKIEEFNTTRKAIPHPGFMGWYKYCPNCGRKL